jgi:hypothetical protein
MSANPMPRIVDMPDRLCYSCNEGHCARCNGWDRTVIDGEIVLVPCYHECRASEQRKPNQRVATSAIRKDRRA